MFLSLKCSNEEKRLSVSEFVVEGQQVIQSRQAGITSTFWVEID